MRPSKLLGAFLCSLVCLLGSSLPGTGAGGGHPWAPAPTRAVRARAHCLGAGPGGPQLLARRPSPFSKLSPNFPTSSAPRPAPLPS